MNWSLEIARALTGGIGIVLTIPITILFMEIFGNIKEGETMNAVFILALLLLFLMIIFGGKRIHLLFNPIFKFRYFNY